MAQYYRHQEFSSSSSTITGERPSPVRRLPTVPSSSSLSVASSPSSDRRASRPLPKIPRALVCKHCATIITSHNVLLPQSQIPPDSRSFKGFSGRALLFTETYNVKVAKPGIQLMATGAHTMSEVTCSGCHLYLGWKIVRAHETTERWKEGYFLLELEHMIAQNEAGQALNLHSARGGRKESSGSDSHSE